MGGVMPLSPLPASNTKRYFVGIQAGGFQHHVLCRTNNDAGDTDVTAVLQFQFGLLAPVMFSDTHVNELLVADAGSDIRNPVSGWTIIDGEQPGPQPTTDNPLSLAMRGRSRSGRKTRLFLWGILFARTPSWVLIPTPESELDAFAAAVAGSVGIWKAIDGTQSVWGRDYTIDFNDHWVGQERP